MQFRTLMQQHGWQESQRQVVLAHPEMNQLRGVSLGSERRCNIRFYEFFGMKNEGLDSLMAGEQSRHIRLKERSKAPHRMISLKQDKACGI